MRLSKRKNESQRSVFENVNRREKVETRIFSDRQTEKDKVPEVDEKERRTYAEVVGKYVD